MKTFNSYYGSSTATPAYSDGDIGRVTNNLLPDNLNWGLETLNDSIILMNVPIQRLLLH
jgi:hypothetical protein